VTTKIVGVYEALRAIDVPDEQAKAAARALTADVNSETRSLRTEIEGLRKETATEFAATRKETAAEFASVRREIASLRTEGAVLRWMSSTSLALSVAILVKLFLP